MRRAVNGISDFLGKKIVHGPIAPIDSPAFHPRRLPRPTSLDARGFWTENKVDSLRFWADLLVDLLLVRRLEPVLPNVGKRLLKSPRIFVRDSGLVHALLGIETRDDPLGHPVAGPSWEGFGIENLLAAAPRRMLPGFYRAAAGAEMDLVLDLPGKGRWAVEIKRGLAPRLEKGFHQARADLGPSRCYVVYPGDDRYYLTDGVEVIGLRELATELRSLRSASD